MFIKASNRIENTVENKKNYNGIDLIKFICAFLICSIHTLSVEGTSFSDNLGFYFKNGICRIAVPFYFATTAFYCLENKVETCQSKMIVSKNVF